MTKKERYKKALEWFAMEMPNAKSELDYRNPYELLVAVMLSAQCTDKRVNMVTPALFSAYPTPRSLALATKGEVLHYICSISYPNSKAEHLIGMAKMVQEKFAGVIPSTMDDLQQLPGVGRKTANVMMIVAFGKPAMPVDTHVFRVSERIGFTTNSHSPHETEMELLKNIPQEQLIDAHHWILLHGRYVCTARNPHCSTCGISSICRFYKTQISLQ